MKLQTLAQHLKFYYPGRRFVPAPLRAFIDFVKNDGHRALKQRTSP